MLDKKFFFSKNNFYKRELSKNIKKTKKCFNKFKLDLDNFEIPLLDSYEKGYNFNFSNSMIKRFNKHKNIIIIGMGGSVLGTKSIYSFFKKKTKKNFYFFDNLDSKLNYEYKLIYQTIGL